jgi:hypothetical protein
MGMLDEDLRGIATDGWRAVNADPCPGDDLRREMGYSGFGGLKPPARVEAKFDLGQVVVTPGARTALSMPGSFDHDLARTLLERFVAGDWGEETPPERAAENQAAQGGGGRIAACYPVGHGMVVWLVSEWDRTLTSFVGAGEYR